MSISDQKSPTKPDSRATVMPVASRHQALIAYLAISAILLHLVARYLLDWPAPARDVPLWAALLFGGIPLVWDLLRKLWRREFGSDLLAGIAIVTSVVLGEYLAGTLVVLMLSGGEALEAYAVRSASSVLEALSNRIPAVAHRRRPDEAGSIEDIPLAEVVVGNRLVVFPHEICPVDGTVVDGHSVMDESYLTGEPYMMSKGPGSTVLSGSINGDTALEIEADKLAIDSRYAKIMRVMEESEQQRPRLRRLGDQLGSWYTPLAILIALGAWAWSGDAVRFLAVMVVATPCPLLIAIPVAIIGSISLAAKRGIIIKDPVALERAQTCRVLIFDKTGTLTYGEPELTDQWVTDDFRSEEVLAQAASLERYSKHPLAEPVLKAAQAANLPSTPATKISEKPGQGLRGRVGDHEVEITSRKLLRKSKPHLVDALPAEAGGLECVVVLDGRLAALYRFRDAPRPEGEAFIRHLGPKHQVERVLLVSGDRESEVRYLADQVGIREVFASQSPEQKVAIVREENSRAATLFVGDGINDAPALMTATVGIAMGQNSDITTEAASVVILDSSLARVDEFIHISARMRRIALQSALGGMALSILGMLLAFAGYLPPVAGAVAQEVIDVFAVLNALRVAVPPKALVDY